MASAAKKKSPINFAFIVKRAAVRGSPKDLLQQHVVSKRKEVIWSHHGVSEAHRCGGELHRNRKAPPFNRRLPLDKDSSVDCWIEQSSKIIFANQPLKLPLRLPPGTFEKLVSIRYPSAELLHGKVVETREDRSHLPQDQVGRTTIIRQNPLAFGADTDVERAAATFRLTNLEP